MSTFILPKKKAPLIARSDESQSGEATGKVTIEGEIPCKESNTNFGDNEEEEEEDSHHQHLSTPELEYDQPTWSSLPTQKIFVETVKQGVILEKVALPMDKEFLTFGRLPTCYLSMEHPSVSRLHAVLQFSKDGGIYLFDLESSHGTFLNKARIPPKKYVALKSGSFVKFGESSRLYIFYFEPFNDKESLQFEGEGEGGDSSLHPFPPSSSPPPGAIREEEECFINPIKTIREWFQENGSRLNFEKVTKSNCSNDGQVTLRITIPAQLGSSLSEELVIEESGAGRREAELAVCRKACEQLCQLGEIVKENYIGDWTEWKRKRREDEEDEHDAYYHDQTFTSKRKQLLGPIESQESLWEKRSSIALRINELESKLETFSQALPELGKGKEGLIVEDDELDQYMNELGVCQKLEDYNSIEKEKNLLGEELHRIDDIILKLGLSPPPLTNSIHSTTATTTATASSFEQPMLVAKSLRQIGATTNNDQSESPKREIIDNSLTLEIQSTNTNNGASFQEEVDEWLPENPSKEESLKLKSKYGY